MSWTRALEKVIEVCALLGQRLDALEERMAKYEQ